MVGLDSQSTDHRLGKMCGFLAVFGLPWLPWSISNQWALLKGSSLATVECGACRWQKSVCVSVCGGGGGGVSENLLVYREPGLSPPMLCF